MSSDRDVVTHLADCFDAIYQTLGELAPLLSFDPFVVCVHEMSRSFGAVALAMREYTGLPPSPLRVIETVLRQSWGEDPSGALTLYALAIVVGPRLLVSLRDALEIVTDAEARELLDRAQLVSVGQILRVGALTQSPDVLDEARWQRAARELVDMVESGPNADSFGTSR
ncbi:MAG: hypothetical protein ABSG09_04415 [Acidimicrobiales bacterium]